MPSDHQSQFANSIRFVQKAVILHPSDDKRFLILIRNNDDSSRPGDFDIPGGNVSKNELHDDALLREIREETGLEVRELKPGQVVSRYNQDKELYFLYIGYSAVATTTDVIIDTREHEEYRWMTREQFEAEAPNHMLHEQIVRALQK